MSRFVVLCLLVACGGYWTGSSLTISSESASSGELVLAKQN